MIFLFLFQKNSLKEKTQKRDEVFFVSFTRTIPFDYSQKNIKSIRKKKKINAFSISNWILSKNKIKCIKRSKYINLLDVYDFGISFTWYAIREVHTNICTLFSWNNI